MTSFKKSDRPKTAGYSRSNANFRAWTEDEENRVKAGLLEGKSFAEIATNCNRTEKAIKMRTFYFATQDISKGAAPDIILQKYRITKEEFSEYDKNTKCKYAECKNTKSPKSALGYCAEHLNIERVGKNDLDNIMAKVEQNQKMMELLNKILESNSKAMEQIQKKQDTIENMLKEILVAAQKPQTVFNNAKF